MPQRWIPISETAKAVYMAGFQYDPDQDIISSRMDAWQRKFGYAYAYDLAAPVTISAVIDCEPFFFRYNKIDWMIELWKGQYGLETGGEIGVYRSGRTRIILDSTLGNRLHDPGNSKFFDCVKDHECLMMSFTLKRNGVPLFSRGPEISWWLTGFKWGVLSKPGELVMDLCIRMPEPMMREAFVNAVKGAGYQNIEIDGDSVSFTFDKPKTIQPRSDPKFKSFVDSAQALNSNIVANYQDLQLENNDPNMIQDEVAGEFIGYFDFYHPRLFNDRLITVLKDIGYRQSDLTKALKYILKPKSKSAFIRRIWTALTRFFKKIFS
jgi:hypothetical protein